MKKLASYKFKNDKEISVEFYTHKETKKKFKNKVDTFGLVFRNGKNRTVMGLRPDEITIIISLLGYALHNGVKTYDMEALKGYNGFGFRK